MHVNGVFAIVDFRNVSHTKVQNYTETLFSNFLKLKSTAVEETWCDQFGQKVIILTES